MIQVDIRRVLEHLITTRCIRTITFLSCTFQLCSVLGLFIYCLVACCVISFELKAEFCFVRSVLVGFESMDVICSHLGLYTNKEKRNKEMWNKITTKEGAFCFCNEKQLSWAKWKQHQRTIQFAIVSTCNYKKLKWHIWNGKIENNSGVYASNRNTFSERWKHYALVDSQYLWLAWQTN